MTLTSTNVMKTILFADNTVLVESADNSEKAQNSVTRKVHNKDGSLSGKGNSERIKTASGQFYKKK